jgi:hypothetical protein
MWFPASGMFIAQSFDPSTHACYTGLAALFTSLVRFGFGMADEIFHFGGSLAGIEAHPSKFLFALEDDAIPSNFKKFWDEPFDDA